MQAKTKESDHKNTEKSTQNDTDEYGWVRMGTEKGARAGKRDREDDGERRSP